MDTVKLKLTIAYDGTAYAGWQTQSTGVTVQQKVEEVLARYFPTGQRCTVRAEPIPESTLSEW